MAHDFSFQCQPFDDQSSVFLHNTQFISSGLIVEEEDMISVSIGDHVHVSHEQSPLETESSIVDDSCSDQIMVNQINLSDKKRKNSVFSSLTSNQPKENERGKGKKQKKCNGESEENEKEEEASMRGKKLAEKKKDSRKIGSEEETPTGYIHVRARRGQATDSHSLAERVRREKISERMKALQRLVPGCDKVTGKALVLDDIINYVQSLQSQVEMLKLKLAAVNPFFYDSSGMNVSALMMSQESLCLSSIPSSSVVPPLQLQECSPNQPTSFADSNNTSNAAINAYPPLLHTSSPSLLLPYLDHDLSLLTLFSNSDESRDQFSASIMGHGRGTKPKFSISISMLPR